MKIFEVDFTKSFVTNIKCSSPSVLEWITISSIINTIFIHIEKNRQKSERSSSSWKSFHIVNFYCFFQVFLAHNFFFELIFNFFSSSVHNYSSPNWKHEWNFYGIDFIVINLNAKLKQRKAFLNKFLSLSLFLWKIDEKCSTKFFFSCRMSLKIRKKYKIICQNMENTLWTQKAKVQALKSNL